MNQDTKQEARHDDGNGQSNEVKNNTKAQKGQNISANNDTNNLNLKANIRLFSRKNKLIGFLLIILVALALIWAEQANDHKINNSNGNGVRLAQDQGKHNVRDQEAVKQQNQKPEAISQTDSEKEGQEEEKNSTQESQKNEAVEILTQNNVAQNANISSQSFSSDNSAPSQFQADEQSDLQEQDHNQVVVGTETESQSSSTQSIYEAKHQVVYRHYLANVSQLLFNFLQDKQVTDQLNYLKSIRLPQKYESLLKVLQEYNSNYLMEQNNNIVGNDIISNWLAGNWLVSKFVKIQKLPSKEQVALKAIITSQLQDFIYFLDSEESQNIFINKVKE